MARETVVKVADKEGRHIHDDASLWLSWAAAATAAAKGNISRERK